MCALLTVRHHNLYGNILTGLCALVLGLAWMLDASGYVVLFSAFALLSLSGLSLFACLSLRHERPDEMARAHEGVASGVALKVLMLACAVLCGCGMAFRLTIGLAPACSMCIGLGLLVYGLVFAVLERGDGDADYQDARVSR